MNRVFSHSELSLIPDGTLLSLFLNAKDNQTGLSFNQFDGFSIAGGIIEPGVSSKIHLHPYVTQVTYVLEGTVIIKMKDADSKQPYENICHKDEAVLTEPNTFFQLINTSDKACRTLYIVSPPYLFEMSEDGKEVIYNDALVLDETWALLEKQGWQPSKPRPAAVDRQDAYNRLEAKSKGNTTS